LADVPEGRLLCIGSMGMEKAVTADVIQILRIQRVVVAETWLSKKHGVGSLRSGLTTG